MPQVFIPAQLRGLTAGIAQIEIQAASVREVVEALEARFPGIKERLCQGDELAPGLQLSIQRFMPSASGPWSCVNATVARTSAAAQPPTTTKRGEIIGSS